MVFTDCGLSIGSVWNLCVMPLVWCGMLMECGWPGVFLCAGRVLVFGGMVWFRLGLGFYCRWKDV